MLFIVYVIEPFGGDLRSASALFNGYQALFFKILYGLAEFSIAKQETFTVEHVQYIRAASSCAGYGFLREETEYHLTDHICAGQMFRTIAVVSRLLTAESKRWEGMKRLKIYGHIFQLPYIAGPVVIMKEL